MVLKFAERGVFGQAEEWLPNSKDDRDYYGITVLHSPETQNANRIIYE